MDRRINKILSSKKSAQSVDQNSYINLQVNNNERLLPPSDINKVVDITEQFNNERQSCPYYRIFGKISTLTLNSLFNINGTYPNAAGGGNAALVSLDGGGYEAFDSATLKRNLDADATSNYTFAEALGNRLKNINGWYGYLEPDVTRAGLCNFYQMTPNENHFSLTDNVELGLKNWELTITYPYISDTTHMLINGGVLIVDTKQIIVGGKQMIAIGVPIKHNLNVGDTVRLFNTDLQSTKNYEVKAIGLENGELNNYYFSIDVQSLTINLVTSTTASRFKKIYNNVESTYYLRKFKEIKTKLNSKLNGNYDITNLGFSLSIFNENVVHFNLNDDIDISEIKDNLGRPLSELYLTIIKTNSSGIFSKIDSGIEAPLISILNNQNQTPLYKTMPIIQKLHNVSSWAQSASYTPLESNITINNQDFYGDIVEYNKTTLEEVKLSDIVYRFNTENRETSTLNVTIKGVQEQIGPRPEGYYYKPHYQIRIRDFSSYIEEGDQNTEGIPDYAENLGDGRIIWRNLLEINGTDLAKPVVKYPFLNGYHYIFKDIVFGLKRQDPFDNWDLYYSKFPADPPGNRTSNNFKTNFANNDC
jgi:hypothetical protein